MVPPLPNHMFTRDTSAWIYDGVSINAMRKRARERETIHYEAIYRWHPLFAEAGFPVWSDGRVNGMATTEGGDIHVLGRGAVLVGMSERTTPQGIERLALRLFAKGSARRIVAIAMPKKRAFMHLDTVMSMVTEDTFTKYAGLDAIAVHDRARTPRRSCGSPRTPQDMHTAIADALGLTRSRCSLDPGRARRA
jgi:arginine deiminase